MNDNFLSALQNEKQMEADALARGYKLALPQECGVWLANDDPARYRRTWTKPISNESWEQFAAESQRGVEADIAKAKSQTNSAPQVPDKPSTPKQTRLSR